MSATANILAGEVLTPGVVPVTMINPVGVGCGVVGTSTPATNFTINGPLTLAPASLPGGSAGSVYVQSLAASGGTSPYSTPVVSSGSAPPGTVFSAGSVSINFTPVGATPFNFTLSMTDAGGGSTSQAYTITIGQPSSATAIAGTPQAAQVNTNFATPLTVHVSDFSSMPVQGTQVTFTAPGSGASGTFVGSNVAFTNAAGDAAVTFKANTIAGSYAVTTAVAGLTATPPSFSLTNVAGAPASIMTTSGSGQSGTVGNSFAAPLVATVRDTFANAVAGAMVYIYASAPARYRTGHRLVQPIGHRDRQHVWPSQRHAYG